MVRLLIVALSLVGFGFADQISKTLDWNWKNKSVIYTYIMITDFAKFEKISYRLFQNLQTDFSSIKSSCSLLGETIHGACKSHNVVVVCAVI